MTRVIQEKELNSQSANEFYDCEHPWRWEEAKLINAEFRGYLKSVREGTLYEFVKLRCEATRRNHNK